MVKTLSGLCFTGVDLLLGRIKLNKPVGGRSRLLIWEAAILSVPKELVPVIIDIMGRCKQKINELEVVRERPKLMGFSR